MGGDAEEDDDDDAQDVLISETENFRTVKMESSNWRTSWNFLEDPSGDLLNPNSLRVEGKKVTCSCYHLGIVCLVSVWTDE